MDYFAVFCHEYGYINNLFWKNGGLILVLRSSVYKYFSIGFPNFGLGHFNMNLNENLHQC